MVAIANVVGSGSLGFELDVEQLGANLDVPYTGYDPQNYHALYVRLEEDRPLITVYRSRKYIISGSRVSTNSRNPTTRTYISCLR